MNNLTYGFDIGIASTGVAIFDNEKNDFVELSVRRFEQAKEAKTRRLAKSAARTLERKKWRKDQLLALFDDYGIISKEEIGVGDDRNNYLNFYIKGDNYDVPNVYTVYHLRQKALTEQVSKREILLCIYNILQARGHFLLDTIDFSRDGITFELFRDKFYELAEKHVSFLDDRTDFEKEILQQLYKGLNSGIKDLQNQLKKSRYTKDDEESDSNLYDICTIVAGYKAKIGHFYGVEKEDDKKGLNINDLKMMDDINEFQASVIELYDLCRIARILKDGCNYVCDIAVKEIDRFSKLKKEKADPDQFDEWKNLSKKKIRSYKNLGNNYPNGLYVKEVAAILNNQSKYYPEITPEFIEICCSIISARIPYYVGPLGEKARNKWADKNTNFKYSYDYSIKHLNAINQFETIKKWKENMVSHCTYLPEEVAMPKGSLIGEVFSIVNEMNNLQYFDNNGELYQLTREDKIKIFDELFLQKDEVTFSDIEKTLNLYKCETKKGNNFKFNNKISIYRTVSLLCSDYRISSVVELFKDKAKVTKIEELLLNINLFDQGKMKYEYFKNELKFTDDIAKKLSNINVKGFYSISKKFVFETPMNIDGDSMLDILFEDNADTFVNNQQVIISNACDKDGNRIDFLADKYEKILKENGNKLSIDLLIDKGKPLMPISRPVIRALNEAFKMYNACLEIYGVPKRVIVETANGDDGIKDFTEQNNSTMKHFDQMPKLIEYIDKQIAEIKSKKKTLSIENKLENWDEIEVYYATNKKKIELYIRQNGIDLLTGKKIDIHHLEEYEVDHILPRGFGNDSLDDKMLISKIANAKKGDRLPIEFLESEDAAGFTSITVGEFTKKVNELFEMKVISNKKQSILLMKDKSEAEIFINQNIVDTRYIISQFVSMLNAFNKANGFDTHIVCMNGSFTSVYRKFLNVRKDRNLGDQHHAYDAAMLCIADKCLNCYFPNYDRRPNARRMNEYSPFETYSEFVKEIKSLDSDTDEQKLKRFIYTVFRKAFNQDVYKLHTEAPLLTHLKSITPLISWKVEKNYDGKLFDATLYKPKVEGDKSVLSVLSVNNNKRSFDSVYPVAVDFYKINHKHYAIHIPLAIIENDGKINKEKYLKLIKEHYKADDLLDENGDLNLKAYKFRAFKRDIIYDTCSNEPHLFNLGSIAIKKLEIMPLNIFSYKDIYELSSEIKTLISSKFNLKTKSNEKGVEFKVLDKKTVFKFLIKEIEILNNNKQEKRLFELTEDIKNINDYCNSLSYYSYIANLKYAPPVFDKQILPVANNEIIKKLLDAEYVKLKYNELGVRFTNNEKGTLIISGPSGYKNGGFKKIKKEEFSWKISKM